MKALLQNPDLKGKGIKEENILVAGHLIYVTHMHSVHATSRGQ